jgi:hypothetical protein
MEAFKYTDAGKLGRIEHILLFEGLIVLCKAGVQASMSFNTIYEAWVALADDGDIKFGACTCKAGLVTQHFNFNTRANTTSIFVPHVKSVRTYEFSPASQSEGYLRNC